MPQPATFHRGDQAYRIWATERAGRRTAHSVRVATGDRYGGDFIGDSEEAAVDAVARWLKWQGDHEAALIALQAAERAYHRVVAEDAFGNTAQGSARAGARREALEELERARVHLDEVRSRFASLAHQAGQPG